MTSSTLLFAYSYCSRNVLLKIMDTQNFISSLFFIQFTSKFYCSVHKVYSFFLFNLNLDWISPLSHQATLYDGHSSCGFSSKSAHSAFLVPAWPLLAVCWSWLRKRVLIEVEWVRQFLPMARLHSRQLEVWVPSMWMSLFQYTTESSVAHPEPEEHALFVASLVCRLPGRPLPCLPPWDG